MKLPFMRKCTLTYICGIIGIIILLVNDFVSAYQANSDGDWLDDADAQYLPTDKRYAMLSYSFRPRTRYGGRRRYRPYRKHYSHNQNYDKPWMKLANTWCFRKLCNTSNDCCRRHNICDASVKRCIDCWYGYPCKRNSDCCQRFPTCEKSACKN